MNFLFKISLLNLSKYPNNCKFTQIYVKKSMRESFITFTIIVEKSIYKFELMIIFVIMRWQFDGRL